MTWPTPPIDLETSIKQEIAEYIERLLKEKARVVEISVGRRQKVEKHIGLSRLYQKQLANVTAEYEDLLLRRRRCNDKENQMNKLPDLMAGIWERKGEYYQVLGYARSHDTGEVFVAYITLRILPGPRLNLRKPDDFFKSFTYKGPTLD